jgi:hypothetical protein
MAAVPVMGTSAIADRRTIAQPEFRVETRTADAAAIGDAGRIDGDVAALAEAAVIWTIEIEFGATAMSSVEEAQSGNHPAPSQIVCLMCFPIL